MYTVSTIVQDSTNLSVLPIREQICKAIDKNTGETCGETESLQILNEFRKLYEARIEKVDSESANEFDRLSMKMKIMTEWIKDLGEQNIMLVNTVQDLEQTASDRVKILEEKLKQSSKVVSDKILLSNQSEERLNVLSNRIKELEDDEKYLHQSIEFLWIDIKGLLELLKRAQKNNCWSLDGIKFCYINPSDIPTPLDCVCAQLNADDTINSKQAAEQEADDTNIDMYQIKFEENAEIYKKLPKEETVTTYVSDSQYLINEVISKSQQANHIVGSSSVPTNSDNTILIDDIVESKYVDNGLEVKKLQKHLQDTESNITNMTHLHSQLKRKDKEIEEIKCQINCLKKEFMETHEALFIEITKKDKLITSLNQEIAKLKEQYNYAVDFKDDIIKKMRKEFIKLKDKDLLSNPTNSYQEVYLLQSQTEETIQHSIANIDVQLKYVQDALQNEELKHDTDKSVDTWMHDTTEKLIKNIENIFIICKEKKKAIEFMEYATNKQNEIQSRTNNCITEMSKDTIQNPITTQQFKLMEEYRVCTVEAQAATEDIREEISTILSSFTAQHQKVYPYSSRDVPSNWSSSIMIEIDVHISITL
ncbi:hypothetical protein M0804_000782 [Polistes exclamans]|nr:hypothetical protein M0804_000782 [Polistes exclamans]